MRFKINKHLFVIGLALPEIPAEFGKNFCRACVDAGLLKEDPDNYGRTVAEAMGELPVSKVASFVSGYLGLKPIPADVFDAFCKLTVMGDGDCPVCGGNLVYDETEGHELNDGDYYTPNSWVPDLYCYHCANCGKIIKTPNEL